MARQAGMATDQDESAWFDEGLRFTCTRCGACCTGAPGYVWVDLDQITRLAEHRGVPVDEFSRAYVRRVGQRYSLIERPGGDCIFWDSQTGCTVYPARPTQCRTWPFWTENIETPEAWDQTRRICPGAGQGRLYRPDEIRASASSTPD